MPGETINLTSIAEKVASDLFSKFGWILSGPTNENFACKKVEEHRKSQSPTHPSDAVFRYDDPYESRRKYFLTDLKSYAKDTITPGRLKGTLRDLAKSVECANVSTEWRQKFANEGIDRDIHGLLFIYNHDGEFDRDFVRYFADEAPKKLVLPARSKIFIIGPTTIGYLLTLLTDLRGLTADRKFPFFDQVPFLYPDRIRRFAKQSTNPIGRIELLIGPWQVVPYDFSPQLTDGTLGSRQTGYYIYYQGTGESVSEFEFLIDFCFRNALVRDGVTIGIRMPNAAANALHNFDNAKENFARNFYSSPDIHKRLEQFGVSVISIKEQIFLRDHIGMERRTNG